MTDEKKPPLQRIIEKAVGTAKAIGGKARTLTTTITDFVQYDLFGKFKVGTTEIAFPIDVEQETVWATYEQMAALFGVDRTVIVKHVKTVLAEGGVEAAATCAKIAQVRIEGSRSVSREVDHFNLDMILAVGFKVGGPRAIEFRKWASQILKNYLVDGYALNGRRLSNDPAALFKLAQEVRALRQSEKSRYEQVREAFKLCALDYDKDSAEARTFYAHCQDMFHYAVSDETAAMIVFNRCDASKPAMGMLSLGNKAPTFADARIAKYYLTGEELRAMEILGEQWLLYAEGMAQRQKQVSMARLLAKLQEIIAVNEYSAFPGYTSPITRAKADEHVRQQLAIYKALPSPGRAA